MVRGWDRGEFLSVRMEWIYVFAAMLVHSVVHLALLYFVVPRCVDECEPVPCSYEEVARKSSCNWFNANPVHCLRSLHHYCHDPPHIFDYPGKGHLHKANVDIHAYYEAPDFEEEQSLVQDLLCEVKTIALGASDSALRKRPSD